MSASREKQLRQEQANSGHINPKAVREAEQRAKEKRSTILYSAIAVVFVLALAATVVWRSNVIQKKAPAMTIDGEAYTAAEVTFYFQNAYLGFMNTAGQYSSMLGIDFSSPLKGQTVNETANIIIGMLGLPAAATGDSWYDYFMDQATAQMVEVQAGLKAAEADGYTYPESVQIEYELNMDALTSSAEASNLTLDEFLARNFGSGMDERTYNKHLLRLLQFEAYAADYASTLKYSDDELEAAYAKDRKSYDRVGFEGVEFSFEVEPTKDADGKEIEPTEAEIEAAKKLAKEKADTMMAAYLAGGDLEALAKETEGATYSTSEGAYYYSGAVDEWMFDESRKAGDCEIVEDETAYTIVVFKNRYREEYNTVDVRHILIQPEAGTKTSEEEGYKEEQEKLLADAKAKAEDVLAQWKAGEATALSFAELALEHSSDPGSMYDGGLYTNVAKGQMVEPFEAWCFEPSRKVGDTGIVETSYGYHVMYFNGENEVYWKLQVAAPMKTEDYSAWIDSMTSSVSVKQHNFGMSFVAG